MHVLGDVNWSSLEELLYTEEAISGLTELSRTSGFWGDRLGNARKNPHGLCSGLNSHLLSTSLFDLTSLGDEAKFSEYYW